VQERRKSPGRPIRPTGRIGKQVRRRRKARRPGLRPARGQAAGRFAGAARVRFKY